MNKIPSSEELLKIKNNELMALSHHTSSEVTLGESVDDLVSMKRLIASIIKGEFVHTTPTSTNIEQVPFKNRGLSFHYTYQREGVQITGVKPVELLYGIDLSSTELGGGFSASGQAATSAVLASLYQAYKVCSVVKESEVYFETLAILSKQLENNNKECASVDITIIDSTSSDLKKINFNKKNIYIIDTTLIARSSNTLRELIKKAILERVRLILVRSHLKLDSFGTDYGNLGSFLVINQSYFPHIPPFVFTRPFLLEKSITTLINENLITYGASFEIDKYYPFLMDDHLNKLNRDRIKRLQLAGEYIEKKISSLENTNFELITYPHHLYFKIKINWKIEHLGIKFLKLCQLYKIKGHFCDSFGFDFFCLNNVHPFNKDKDQSIFRFSPPDQVEIKLDKCVLIISNLLIPQD